MVPYFDDVLFILKQRFDDAADLRAVLYKILAAELKLTLAKILLFVEQVLYDEHLIYSAVSLKSGKH